MAGFFKKLDQLLDSIAAPQPKVPEPRNLGDLLVSELLSKTSFFRIPNQQFNELVKNDYTKELIPAIAILTKAWIIFYLTWVMHMMARAKHGDTFAMIMMQHVYESLDNSPKELTGGDYLSTGIRFWFERLESAAVNGDEFAKANKIPIELVFANCFLSLDGSSPYFKNAADISKDALFAVCEALCSAKKKAMPFMHQAVERGTYQR